MVEASKAWDPGSRWCRCRRKSILLETSTILRQAFLFCQAFNGLDEATHILEGFLFYSEFTTLTINLIQNTLQVDT